MAEYLIIKVVIAFKNVPDYLKKEHKIVMHLIHGLYTVSFIII